MKFALVLPTAALMALSHPATTLASPESSSPLGGPVVAGVCLLSQQAVVANAKIGVAAAARLDELSKQARAEVAAEEAPINADLKAYQAEKAKLTPAQRQEREQALAPRLQAVQAKAQLRGREIEATREKAMAQITGYARPIITQAYKAKGCGMLLDRNTVIGGNMANDLTADVVKGLDAQVTTIKFDREVLPAQVAAR